MSGSPFNNKNSSKASMAFNYRTDGSGRDSYIYSNNGGFTIHNQTYRMPSPGKMNGNSPGSKQATQGRRRVSPVQGKPVQYVSNGTGRDGYIFATSGGFTCSNRANGGQHTFFN